jgi:FkbM family methyltransferase
LALLPIDLIDVGAVGGLGPPWRDRPDAVGHVLSFEPNQPARRDGRRWTHASAIWHRNGRARFYVGGADGSGSSLLRQNSAWVAANFARLVDQGDPRLNRTWQQRSAISKVVEIEVRTLDSVLAEVQAAAGGGPRFRFLKSDTQSGEWFVLQGAQGFLARDCVGLELELFRYPLYRGMVLEDDVKAWLGQRGFRVAGWSGYQASFASQADYLFLRAEPRDQEERALVQTIEAIYAPKGPERLIKQPPFLERLKGAVRRRLPEALLARR